MDVVVAFVHFENDLNLRKKRANVLVIRGGVERQTIDAWTARRSFRPRGHAAMLVNEGLPQFVVNRPRSSVSALAMRTKPLPR